ncbi:MULTISPECIES: hypothetical protein [unclassified Streptomyces]|uniref:hypothetical protein n=1 Tax=unclassified Streptomyces TaxID=2593676 RepID=UPI00368975CC
MRSARPGRLRLGDQVRFENGTYTVVALTGMWVRLADVHGTGMLIDQVHLQAAEDFAVVGTGERAALGTAALLDHLPDEVAKRALWWQRHLVEVLTGLSPDAPQGALPRPEVDSLDVALAVHTPTDKRAFADPAAGRLPCRDLPRRRRALPLQLLREAPVKPSAIRG